MVRQFAADASAAIEWRVRNPLMTTERKAPPLELVQIRHRYGESRARGPGSTAADRSAAADGPAAVDDVSLVVGTGEVVCLLGPSGCGKSTLLRIAAGLEPLQSGLIRMHGHAIADPAHGIRTPPERRGVGLVFQDSALFPHLSVLRNVTFGLDRMRPHERQARARQLLGQLGMEAYAEVFPHMLSGGQQQRVALARALAPAPALMLLDEPFSSLDARLRDQIRDDTLHILKSTGTGTLLVTHDPEEAMFMADRIALMRDGRIVQAGTPEELYCRPVDPFVVRFFGDVNVLSGSVREGCIVTAAGTVVARGLADGAAATVLVRPEALRVAATGAARADATIARVVASRLLGSSSVVHLEAGGPGGVQVHLHARVPGVYLPASGQLVDVVLDPAQVFVFADGPAASA